MKPSNIFVKVVCILVLLIMLIQIMPQGGFILPKKEIYRAEKNISSKEVGESLSIDFDPNGGVIKYGTVDHVGARKENDVNNLIFKNEAVMHFPSDYIYATGENGERLFPGAELNHPDYNYAPMLEYAILQEVVTDSTEIMIDEGVYYMGSTIYVWGSFTLNGVYGKTAFVCENNGDGALFKAGTNQTYYQGGSITDITFVVKGTNSAYTTLNNAENITNEVLSHATKPVNDYNAFQGMNISWFTISNCSFAGFNAPFSGLKGHMCSHISDNTIGSTRVVFNGTHFIDCYLHDNYFYGGIIKKDGHYEVPLFTTGLGANLTVFNNNYLENYYFDSHSTVENGGLAYTNCTFDHVYNIKFYNPNVSGITVSQCLFRNNTYQAMATMFESFGLIAYDKDNQGENTYVIRSSNYTGQPNVTFNKMRDYNRSAIIVLWKGVTLTQCRFEEGNMTNTYLYAFRSGKIEYRQKSYVNIQVADNSYQITSFLKDDIFDDGINLRDNGQSADWSKKFYLSQKTSADESIFYDPVACQKIDLACFYNPAVNKTLGYESLGKTGTDEAKLSDTVGEQFYQDIYTGKHIVYLSDFGATPDDMRDDSTYIQRAFDTIAKTGEILCVDGTYNIATPILLRGGKPYRVISSGGKTDQNYNLVGGGFAIYINSGNTRSSGGFIQSSTDNTPISGYFRGVNFYPGNITNVNKDDGSVFCQVNFTDFLFYDCRIGYFNAGFEKCSFDNCLIEHGYAQYNYAGIMKECVFENSVYRHSYATGSLADYGSGIGYAYLFSDTDFINSTFRGNWIEFMQFTNGFRLSGKGNSLFIGNEFDYCYNFQYGENDMSAGNVYTHCSTQRIVGHIEDISGIKPDKVTKEAKNGWLVIFHVNDGMRFVGDSLTSSNTAYTTFYLFDGRNSLYKNEKKLFTSVSNVRIVANIIDSAGSDKELAYFECDELLSKENCLNNKIDFTSIVKSKLYIKDNTIFGYDHDTTKAMAVPGTLIYLWHDQQLHYFGQSGESIVGVKLPNKQLIQDIVYDLPETSQEQNKTCTYQLDFNGNKNVLITDEDGNDIAPENVACVDAMMNHVKWKAMYNGSELTQPLMSVVAKTPQGNSALYTETSYIASEQNENKKAANLSPNFMTVFDEYKNKVITASGSFYGVANENLPVIIYGEDENNYYGFQPALQNVTALRYKTVIVPKTANGGYYGNHSSNKVPITFESSNVISTDISLLGNGKVGNSSVLYFDGTDELVTNEKYTKLVYDEGNLNALVLGVEYICYYDYLLNQVFVTFTYDFSKTISPVDSSKSITKRKFTTSPLSIKDVDAVAGVLYLNDAWTDGLTISYDNLFDRNALNTDLLIPEHEEVCEHNFKTYIRKSADCTHEGFDSYICSRCKKQLQYEPVPMTGHSYESSIENGYVNYTCTKCHHSYQELIPNENFMGIITLSICIVVILLIIGIIIFIKTKQKHIKK